MVNGFERVWLAVIGEFHSMDDKMRIITAVWEYWGVVGDNAVSLRDARSIPTDGFRPKERWAWLVDLVKHKWRTQTEIMIDRSHLLWSCAKFLSRVVRLITGALPRRKLLRGYENRNARVITLSFESNGMRERFILLTLDKGGSLFRGERGFEWTSEKREDWRNLEKGSIDWKKGKDGWPNERSRKG